MDDHFWRRELEEAERLARMADPLRELRDLQNPMVRAQKELAALCRDPFEDVRAQMRALADPPGQLPAWLRDQYGQDPLARQMQALNEPARHAADQLNAMYGQGTIAEQIKALAEPARQAAEQLNAIYDQGAIAEQIKNAFEPARQVADQLRAIYGQDTIAEHVKALLDPYQGAQTWIDALRSDEAERLRQWSTMFDDFAKQLRGMPDEIRIQLTVLMDQGWCLDPEMPHTWGQDLADAFQKGEEEEAQQWLIDYFKDRLGEIEQTVVGRHPARSAIIAEAFHAHRERRYNLSIPVLLAQADGVIHDKHQRQLFSKKRSTNLMQVFADLPDDDMRGIFIAAFYLDIPLTRNTTSLPDDFNGLNRHAVLHGTDPHYGTEINSLRAVSILNFASFLVSEEADATDS